MHLDEAAESEPVSLVVAVQCGRRADFELPRMHGLGPMLQPLLAQPETKIAIVAFDSQVHAVENFTSNENAVTRDLEGLQAWRWRRRDSGCGELFGEAAGRGAQESQARAVADQRNSRSRQPLRHHRRRDQGLGNSNIVVYTLAFSPSKSNVLDTLSGNNNPDLHPEQTEVHERPDLLAPLVLAAQAMRKNTAKAIASLSGGEYQMFDSAKGFDARMNDFSNHLHSRYLLSFQPVAAASRACIS